MKVTRTAPPPLALVPLTLAFLRLITMQAGDVGLTVLSL